MPIYKYTCPHCEAKVERIVKIADRDNQICATENDGGIDPEHAGYICGAQLIREEITETANMRHYWQP